MPDVNFSSWLSGLSVSIPGLEKSLHQYTLEPSEKPFDMKTVPLATTPITEQKTGTVIWLPHTRDFLFFPLLILKQLHDL